MSTEKEIKESMAKYARKLHEKDMVAGPAGNLTVRLGEVFYSSPHAIPMEEYTAEDMVTIDLKSGEKLEGARNPTWELDVHRDIYLNESSIDAIIHVHDPYTNAVIAGGMDWNALIPEFVPLGELPHIKYILPAGHELHDAILDAVKQNKNGLLLRNHGFYTFGKNIRDAYYKAELVQAASKMALFAKIAGKPEFLNESEKEKIRELMVEKAASEEYIRKGTIIEE